MRTFYILLTVILVIIVWFVLQRKWTALLWTMAILVVIVIAGWFLFFRFASEAFGAKCENNRVWKIENYVIIEKKCIGFAGPTYYSTYLYKDDEEIDGRAFINDSTCMVRFKPDAGDTLTFDICKMELKGKMN